MKHSPQAQSATSLRAAPADEADTRVRHYMLTMGVRIACIILMVVVVPYGWYTWLFAAGAVVLPYFAVVIANVGHDSKTVSAVSPERQLTTLPATPSPTTPTAVPGVLRIAESRQPDRPRDDDPPR